MIGSLYTHFKMFTQILALNYIHKDFLNHLIFLYWVKTLLDVFFSSNIFFFFYTILYIQIKVDLLWIKNNIF